MHRLERRLRIIEKAPAFRRRPNFDRVYPDELQKGKAILKAVMETGDSSNYYSDLAAHAPTVLAALIEAGSAPSPDEAVST